MTTQVIGDLHRRILPFTLSIRLLTLTTAPSLAAVLDVQRANAVTIDQPQVVVQEEFSVNDFLTATNTEREAQGIPDLTLNPLLDEAAAHKVVDMRTQGYWDHFRPSDHKAPWDFMTEVGYTYKVAGENLARGFDSVQGITTAWMNSPAHRANLLSPKYTDVGFADAEVTQPDGSTLLYTVQMFGTR